MLSLPWAMRSLCSITTSGRCSSPTYSKVPKGERATGLGIFDWYKSVSRKVIVHCFTCKGTRWRIWYEYYHDLRHSIFKIKIQVQHRSRYSPANVGTGHIDGLWLENFHWDFGFLAIERCWQWWRVQRVTTVFKWAVEPYHRLLSRTWTLA